MNTNRECKDVVSYYLLTILITWLLLLPAVLNSSDIQKVAVSTDLLVMMATFVPSVMALIYTLTKYGKTEVKKLVKRTFDYKFSVKWYLYILFLMPCILIIASVFLKLFSGFELNSLLLPMLESQPWVIIPVFLYMLALQGPLGEELGWRGFAQDRLLQCANPIRASIILGALWTLWHLPLFLITGTIQAEMAANGIIIALTGYLLYTVMLTVLMTVLYLGTNGSILAAILFHTVANLSHGLITIITTPAGGMLILLVMLPATFVVVRIHIKRGAYFYEKL